MTNAQLKEYGMHTILDDDLSDDVVYEAAIRTRLEYIGDLKKLARRYEYQVEEIELILREALKRLGKENEDDIR